jgi:hypothetical protein
MKSLATSRFWKNYAALPPRIQRLAKENYNLWRKVSSIKVGDVVEWVWIGSHEDYNKLVGA